ncbi:NOP protein chaperone 1 [Ctenodactylus gundi]
MFLPFSHLSLRLYRPAHSLFSSNRDVGHAPWGASPPPVTRHFLCADSEGMEAAAGSRGSSSSSSPTRDGSGVSVSQELLTAGSGRGGIWDKLLINSKPESRQTSTVQTVRVERSPLLDQVRNFLPQMAQANEKLRKEMEVAPPGCFNIENIDETLGKVIQMDVAMYEMNDSDSGEEDSSEESSEASSESEDEDDSIAQEVTVDNIRLPNSEGGKGKIEVLDGLPSNQE